MTTNRTASLLLLAIPFLAACASSPQPPSGAAPPTRGMSIPGLDLVLPAIWWRDTQLAGPLDLNGEQLQRLDTLLPQQEEVARVERDLMVAARELRSALEMRNATAAAIVGAGGHLRELQQLLLERQIETVAAQREILTAEQWSALQRALAAQRRPQRPEGEGGRGEGGAGRGRGGHGGRRGGGF